MSYIVKAFTAVGNHTWTVPEGVESVDVLVVAGGGGGGGMSTLREKLSPENDDWILIEDSRTGTYKRIKVGNLANIRR